MCLYKMTGAQAKVEAATYTMTIMCDGGVTRALGAMEEGRTNSTLRWREYPSKGPEVGKSMLKQCCKSVLT